MAGIDGDSAWIKDGAGSYRHYCGVTIARDGRLWTAKTVAGVAIPGHISALEAVVSLEKSDPQFWIFGQYGLRFGVTDCGSVHHKTRPVVCGDDEVFVFCLSKDEQVPKFLKTIIDKHFVGIATCVACLAPMCNLQEQRAAQFDWSSSERDTYLACSCGYAVWRMDRKFYDKAGGIISKRASNWRRTLNLRNAGGKHTREEMQIVIALQDGRCIYCDAIFTDQNRPSKDHLLPVSMGGSDWALNIVLACWGCNSSRGDTPFRTFCRLLSPTQNKKILANLRRRLLALVIKNTPKEAFLCFEEGLALHQPQDHNYIFMVETRLAARRNARINKLLPHSATVILKGISDILG